MKNGGNGTAGDGGEGEAHAALMGRESWTVRPEADVASLMKKAINRLVRRAMRQGVKLERRGLRSRLLNEALRAQLADLKGKREEGKAESRKGGG